MDTSTPLGDIVAERCIDVEDASGAAHEARIQIGKPVEDPRPDGDYLCPFRVVGLGDGAVRCAYGVDAVQAMMLAFKMIGAVLEHHRNAGATLSWLGDEDLGFPTPG